MAQLDRHKGNRLLKAIGWTSERNGVTEVKELKRIPDILIKRDKSDIAIIDAKCMRYSENLDTPSPNSDIVNQMILYLDYVVCCDVGIVLFADDKDRNDIVIKQKDSRKILFLNCYPYQQSDRYAFERIKHYLSIEQA